MAYKREKPNARNIGIWAGGSKIKTYYELTKGTYGEEERKRLQKGIKQIQNLTNKRIKKLLKFEKETGYTSPALKKLRETGLEGGLSVRGSLDQLRKQYKNALNFLRDATSTIPGAKEHVKKLSDLLQKQGWVPYQENENGQQKIYTPDEIENAKRDLNSEEYEIVKELQEMFFKEMNKNIIYKASGGTVERETLRQIINEEISNLLSNGDIESVVERARERLDIIDENGSFET